jgi:hypothetical protein
MPAANMPEPGCYVDSHYGQYAVARAIQVAGEFGWKDGEAAELAARHLACMGPSNAEPLDVDEFERLTDACDDAEEWLNDNVSVSGHAWGWHDGDFGLWALEDGDA